MIVESRVYISKGWLTIRYILLDTNVGAHGPMAKPHRAGLL